MKNALLVGMSALVAALVALGVLFVLPAKSVNQPLGAVSSPIVQSPYFGFGGNLFWGGKTEMRSATTTLCAIQSPAATSSIMSASFMIDTATSTAATIDIGYGTTAFATSTNLLSATSIASGAQGDANWTAAGAGTGDDIVGPNTYVLVKTAGAGLGGYTYGGHCSVLFQQL